MRTLVKAALLTIGLVSLASPASATTLTLNDPAGADSVGTTWTLDVETGCTTCTIVLSGFFEDPGAGDNYYTGTYIDSFQWKINGSDPSPASEFGFSATNAGLVSDWDMADGSLNSSQCGGGADAAVCGQWNPGFGAGLGFQVVNGATLTWSFEAVFASELTLENVISGNIRAAFNTGEFDEETGKYKNFGIFSPGGGSFPTSTPTTNTTTPTTNTPGNVVPEPTIMTLLGAGLVLAGRRFRRRNNA